MTSGRVIYGAFGRVVKTYHPTVDGDTLTAYSDSVDAVPPTRTDYDVLDRPVRVISLDEIETNTSYRMESNTLVTHVPWRRFFCHDSAPEDLYSRVWGNHNYLGLSTHPRQKIITQMAASI